MLICVIAHRFGTLVATVGTTIVVSAPNANSGLGEVYVYRSPVGALPENALFHVHQELISPVSPVVTAW